MADSPDADILIVGAGVLGVTLAYWLSALYDCSIAIADLEGQPGRHTTSRNTGVIHRPYYLDPRKKKVFARTSLLSHAMWKTLARTNGLQWKEAGTLNVALEENEIRVIEQYRRWGVENGMDETELGYLDSQGVKGREPEVSCRAGLLSKTDVSVDFGALTLGVWNRISRHEVRLLGRRKLLAVAQGGDTLRVTWIGSGGRSTSASRFLINAAGGGALDIAHSCGLARDYAMLNFRGEYWVVDEPFANRVSTNIYRPPKYPQYPFLDPHFVVRADGTRQIGPTAVVVPSPYVYSGAGLSKVFSYLARPVVPKASLFGNRDFTSLVAREWLSSLSKRSMCGRVKRFVPGLDVGKLSRRGFSGVRCSVVGGSGFVPEAVLLKGARSAHIINYNSPGATGAPAYSAMVVEDLRRQGFLQGLRPRRAPPFIPGWEYEPTVALL